MNKRALIKFVLVLLTFLIGFFIINANDYILPISNILIFAIIPITLVMFRYRKIFKKNKKIQFAYDVILIILMLISFLFAWYLLYVLFTSLSFSQGEFDLVNWYFNFYLMTIITLLLFSFIDIFKKTDKKNDILVISICIVTILMIFRVYLIPGFNQDIFVYYTLSKNIYSYVSEFIIYFLTLNVLAIIHYYINKV